MSGPPNSAEWAAFLELASRRDEEIDPATTALLIASTEYPELDIRRQLEVLDSLSAGVAGRLSPDQDPLYQLNTLSEYLFDDVGFRGNAEDYYDPRNSFLNEVLSRRLGIPITLALVFIEVGKRLGVSLLGLGMPGHLLLKHPEVDGWYIDPFHRGVLLSEEECAERMRQATGANVAWDARFLTPLNNRQYVARILRNLKAIYWRTEEHQRGLGISEHLVALYPESAQERRDRGLMHLRLGQRPEALSDLEFYLEGAPSNSDAEDVRELVRRLKGD